MTETTNRFEHDRSPYERPNFPFRCGREAAFGRPCPRGPSGSGACQGVSDCTPFQTRKIVTDDETGEEREILRWECRRPQWAGGPCAEGPRPDGACACVHPPCSPRPTIRRQRGRWALLAIAAVVSLALAFVGYGGMAGGPSSIDPGELSGKHAQFTAGDGCASCHEGHSTTLVGWASAIFDRKSISDSCVSCHAFGAEDAASPEPGEVVFAAHNASFPEREDAPTATCLACHTEHRGEMASITPVVDQQCATCHTEQFDNFAKSHPAFGANFPHERARTIKFSHVSHYGKHFEDPRYEERAPAAGCISCHSDQSDGRLLPGSFEAGCAACHEEAITGQGLAVFGLPELPDPELTADAREACGFPPDQMEPARNILAALTDAMPAMESLSEAVEAADPDAIAAATEALMEAKEALEEAQTEMSEAIEEDAISLDEASPAMAYLLGVPGDDSDAYGEPAAAMLAAVVEDGLSPLEEAIEERGGDPAMLLAGLSPDLVQKATCVWVANAEYYSMREPESGVGWAAGATQIAYMPTAHADPVVQSWIGLGLAARESDVEGAETFSESMLHESDGPGRCFKCHVAPAADAENQSVLWAIEREDIRPFTAFDHEPHLNVLDKGAGCATCHQSLQEGETLSDAQKRPGPHANEFKPIEAAICADCHHEQAVRQDCSVCHRYHNEPAIRARK